MSRRRARRLSTPAFIALALALAVGIGTAAAPYASPRPDGLERVAEEQGFAGRGTLHPAQERAPVPGYAVPAIGDSRLATGLAGFAGTLLVFGAGVGAARLLRRRRPAAP